MSKIILTLIITIFFVACDIINPTEGIPAIIEIDSINVNITDATLQGTSDSKITDVTVYLGSNLIGIFELPATIPILEEGNQRIIVQASIKKNGSSATREIYPFYKPYIDDITLSAGAINKLLFDVTYQDSITFAFMEDFEGAGINLLKYSGDTNIVSPITGSEAFDTKSGAIFLDNMNDFAEIITSSSFRPKAIIDKTYLELNYKCDNEFQVFLWGDFGTGSATIEAITITPKAEWNKIYIDLTTGIKTLGALDYKLIFRATKNPDNSTGTIYLDNIKIITG